MTTPPSLSELAARIVRVCRLQGEFRLRSGQTSATYFDKYLFESDPLILSAIADELTGVIPTGTEILAGLELGGIPIATAMSLRSGLPIVFVRKERKQYGTCKLAEGPDVRGRSVLPVEDVTTTGGQVVTSAGHLSGSGRCRRGRNVCDRSPLS